MKQKYLIFVLMFGLLAFSACTSENNFISNNDEIKQDSNNVIEAEDNKNELTSGNYQVNTAESKVIWHGYRLVGNSHTGTVDIKSGSLQIVDGAWTGGEFIIDVASLKSDDELESLENHLKGADFFDVANYPEAKLVITNLTETEEENIYQIDAVLTIKDISESISFFARLNNNGDSVKAETNFSINRTIWDLKYGSGTFFEDLGDKVIGDDIDFSINLYANLEGNS